MKSSFESYALLPPWRVTMYIQWQLSKPGNDWDHRYATTSLSPPPTPSSAKNRSSSLRRGSGTVSRLLSAGRSQLTPSRWRLRLSYIAMLMYLTLNGNDNCTAIAPRPCNGLPMLRRGLEVVGLIILLLLTEPKSINLSCSQHVSVQLHIIILVQRYT